MTDKPNTLAATRQIYIPVERSVSGDGEYSAMITTETLDRYGSVVVADGIQTSNYLRNPVVLANHEYSIEGIVGKTRKLEVMPKKGIAATWNFLSPDINPKADMARRMWDEGFLNATSIGFLPLEMESLDSNDPLSAPMYTKSDMFEFSLVAVPANPDALRLAMSGVLDGVLVPQVRAGRVLSAENERRIRSALADLQTVLDSLGVDESAEQFVVRYVVPYKDHGKSGKDVTWNGLRLSDFTDSMWMDLSDEEKSRIAQHFTYSVNEPPAMFGDLKLGHHDPQKAGVGVANWSGVVAAMQRLNQTDMPADEMRAAYGHLAKHYDEQGVEPPPFAKSAPTPVVQHELSEQDEMALDAFVAHLKSLTHSLKK